LGQLNFKALAWRAPRAPSPQSAGLSLLLSESVAAILTPHLNAALAAYTLRDRPRIFAAYGAGCSILADLMSQTVTVSGWKSAGEDAMRRLLAACELEDLPADTAALAVSDAVWLKRNFDGTAAFLDVCRMFEAALGEIHQSRMTAKGSITIRAAMARLEAMAMNVAAFGNLAA
jgi:hypothetical protein